MPATCSTSVLHSSFFLSPSGCGKITGYKLVAVAARDGCDSRRTVVSVAFACSNFAIHFYLSVMDSYAETQLFLVFLCSNLGREWIFSIYELKSHLCYIPDNFPDTFHCDCQSYPSSF